MMRPPAPSRRSILLSPTTAGVVVAAMIAVAACGGDSSESPPVTTSTGTAVVTTPAEGDGTGTPLEPGSNLPPAQTPSTANDDTTGTTDLLAPADSTAGGG
jgi:hypothetical protein